MHQILHKKYFSKEAWNHPSSLAKGYDSGPPSLPNRNPWLAKMGITLKTCIISTKKENAVYDCCVCQTDLHSKDCVACDVCLNWYHLKALLHGNASIAILVS